MALREFKVKIKSKTVQKEYTMREPLWADDMSLQMQCITPAGRPDMRALWIKRIAAATGKSENEIIAMPQWELEALIQMWEQINNPDEAIFLDLTSREEKISSSSSTSQKQD